jgi:hypothetical protein
LRHFIGFLVFYFELIEFYYRTNKRVTMREVISLSSRIIALIALFLFFAVADAQVHQDWVVYHNGSANNSNDSGNDIALADRYFKTGYHRLNWRADKTSSGIYFCRLKSNTATKSSKLLLLK